MEKIREKQKEEALWRMKKLNILSQAVKDFTVSGKLYRSEANRIGKNLYGMLFYLSDEEKVLVDKFEKEWNGLVYHVIKSYTKIGTMYSLLYVSSYEEEWDWDREDLDYGSITCAYVYNQDYHEFSELGSIGVKSSVGGLIRTA